jgi:RNA polymerase sigma-70 factor (ECF subfamily)
MDTLGADEPAERPRRIEAMETYGSLTLWAQDLYSSDPCRREEAARQLWLRFAERLGVVVRRRLNAQILRRVGVDDVLQSLFGDFFAAPPAHAGPPRSRAELWRRLICFTMRKVANTANFHRAQRRDVRRDRPMEGFASDDSVSGHGWAQPEDFRALSPEDEAMAREEFGRLLAVLPEDLKQVFALRLEGYTNAEIAGQLDRVERTIELKLKTIRGLLRPYVKAAPPAQP